MKKTAVLPSVSLLYLFLAAASTAGTWHTETGYHTAIALDSSDNPHVSYYNWSNDEDLKHAWSIANPMPDIDVNDSDGPLIIQTGQLATVTVSLDPGEKGGDPADWWIRVVKDFAAPWWCRYNGGAFSWTQSGAPLRFAAAKLRVVTDRTVLGPRLLPAGLYKWTFAVDAQNGMLEGTYRDSVQLLVY